MKKQTSQKLIVYSDGGSRGNPGPAALGVVIKNEKSETLKKYGETLGTKTNNEAEYEAAIFALKKIKQLFSKEKARTMSVEVRMDSELVYKQLSGDYKIEEERLFPLFISIWNLKIDFKEVTFKHVFREENKEADEMVNRALDSEKDQQLL